MPICSQPADESVCCGSIQVTDAPDANPELRNCIFLHAFRPISAHPGDRSASAPWLKIGLANSNTPSISERKFLSFDRRRRTPPAEEAPTAREWMHAFTIRCKVQKDKQP